MDSSCYFLEITSKTIVCNTYGFDYQDFYGKCYFYRRTKPEYFIYLLKIKFGPLDFFQIKKMCFEMYKAIPENSSHKTRKKCISIVVEYISANVSQILHVVNLFPGTKTEFCDSLLEFYDAQLETMNNSLYVVHEYDVKIFNQIAHRIAYCQTSSKTATYYTRALSYLHKLIHIPEHKRIYLDNSLCKRKVLRKLQCYYEAILYSKIHIDDFSTNNSILAALRMKNPYKNSKFGGKCENSHCIDMVGEENVKLHLFTAGKTLDLCDVRGALEYLSYCSPEIYCHRKFNHHKYPNKNDISLIDAASHVLMPHKLSKNRRNTVEYKKYTTELIFYRLEKLLTPFDRYTVTEPCKKNIYSNKTLLNENYFTNYERSIQQSITHVQDFLLWIMSTKKPCT